MDETKELWKKAAEFHGHVCGGLTIGYKAALYAIELLGITFSADEQLVCIAENDACGCDAIQAILGCSVGKGNLLFHMTGKTSLLFRQPKDGSVRAFGAAAPRERNDPGGVFCLLPVPGSPGNVRCEGCENPAAGTRPVV